MNKCEVNPKKSYFTFRTFKFSYSKKFLYLQELLPSDKCNISDIRSYIDSYITFKRLAGLAKAGPRVRQAVPGILTRFYRTLLFTENHLDLDFDSNRYWIQSELLFIIRKLYDLIWKVGKHELKIELVLE